MTKNDVILVISVCMLLFTGVFLASAAEVTTEKTVAQLADESITLKTQARTKLIETLDYAKVNTQPRLEAIAANAAAIKTKVDTYCKTRSLDPAKTAEINAFVAERYDPTEADRLAELNTILSKVITLCEIELNDELRASLTADQLAELDNTRVMLSSLMLIVESTRNKALQVEPAAPVKTTEVSK